MFDVRAIINIALQFVLACSLLMCITCNHSEEAVSASDKSDEMKIREEAFVISQIHNACDLIELAEIAVQKGTLETSLRAAVLKDDQVAVLYLFTDFADQKKIRIPAARENGEAKKMYLQSENFDEEWSEIITQRTRQNIVHLEDYFLHADKDSRTVIADVLATLQSENVKNKSKVASN